MTLDKASIKDLENWMKSGSLPEINNTMYVVSSIDQCCAIENIKKSALMTQGLSVISRKICESLLGFDLMKQGLVDALNDDEFCERHISKKHNSLSLASHISFYYQETYPDERESFVEDIVF